MSLDEATLVQTPLASAWASASHVRVTPGNALPREARDVLLPGVAKLAAVRLNPQLPAHAAELAVRAMRAHLAATTSENLVSQAQTQLAWLRDGVRVDLQTDRGNRTRSVRLIDFDNLTENEWAVATEVTYERSPGTSVRFDIVLYCNGIPLVVIETKTNTRTDITWLNAAQDIAGPYTRKAPAFLAAGVLLLATDGRDMRYGAVGTGAARFQAWRSSNPARPAVQSIEQVTWDLLDLTSPQRLLEWARDFILHLADRGTGRLTRFVPRWPQAEAAPLIADRALQDGPTRALVSHFQGSGKTFSILMAANQITRRAPRHLVVLVVDRVDLLGQHKGDFADSDARRAITEAAGVADLRRVLSDPSSSGIVITTVHRFAGAELMSTRDDITVMVDEAHRTHEGSLGLAMRTALPNANLVGLTGTPIIAGPRNTFEAFGDPGDPGRVLHKYTALDSVTDGTTIPLVIDRRRIVQPLSRTALDEAFAEYVTTEGISSTDAELLAAQVISTNATLKDSRRIERIARDVFEVTTARAIPDGYGAMLVVADREACVLYAAELAKHFAPDQFTAVISGTKDDDESFGAYVRDPAAEAVVTRNFRDPENPLKLLVVTSKLLTGFDAKNCRIVFVDRPMKAHTLFQAVTRANRAWTTPAGVEKGYGIVVDYCGVAADLVKALDTSDADTTQKSIASPEELRQLFRRSLRNAEKDIGDGFDWRAPELVNRAHTELAKDRALVEHFKRNVARAELIWETLAGDPELEKDKARLVILVKVVAVFADPKAEARRLVLEIHGAAVRQLLVEHTGDVSELDLPDFTLDAPTIRAMLKEMGDPSAVLLRVQNSQMLASLKGRLERRLEGPASHEYRSLAEKLEAFAGTEYVADADGARNAVVDLADIVKAMKLLDERLGDDADWDEIDRLLHGGRRTQPPPQAAVLNPATALQDVLAEYAPENAPAAVGPMLELIDATVERTSYRALRENTTVQRQLHRDILRAGRRLGILPAQRDAANAFAEKVVEYVNTWMV